MRTTLDIDDDVLAAAKALAAAHKSTAGHVLSDLARQALTRSLDVDKLPVRNGFPVMPSTGKVTEMRRRGEPFKQVLNNAIRTGLRNMRRRTEAFEPLTFYIGKPRVDLTKASSLAAELEDHELIVRYRRSR